jgi:hypothetical protein
MRCDAHVHIVGPVDIYPQLPTRMFLAGMAERLVDDFLRALGSAALADRIMRDNAARLYGFP